MSEAATNSELPPLDELLAKLGSDVAAQEFGVGWTPPVDRALEWLAEHASTLMARVCHERDWLASDEASAVTLIEDAIQGYTGGVPLASVARVLAKVGLDRYCSESNPFGLA